MKKKLWIASLAAFGLSLYGCGGQTDSNGADSGGSATFSGGSSSGSARGAGGRNGANGGGPGSTGGAFSSSGGALSGTGGGVQGAGGASLGTGGASVSEKESCERAADCVLAPLGCCEPCEPVMSDQLKAVNRLWSLEHPTCGEVACEACPPFEVDGGSRKYFRAACEEQRCKLVDFRETENVACEEDKDCHLRTGVGCCESCEAEDLIAYSSLEYQEECGLVLCESCAPEQWPASPVCDPETSRCVVSWVP